MGEGRQRDVGDSGDSVGPSQCHPLPAPSYRRRTLPSACPPCLLLQVDEEGAPLLDWGLAAEALNKADAGVPEKVGAPRLHAPCHMSLPCCPCRCCRLPRPAAHPSCLPRLLDPPAPPCPHPRFPLQVLLMSRDELSMLVVSYADVRRCVASCYEELRSRSSSAYPAPQPGGGGGGGSGAMNRSRSRPSMQQQQQQQH